jgi:hypothetical protein
MKCEYTKEHLEPIVKKCFSIREVLIALQKKPCGGNYKTINKYLIGIDTSHFKGRKWNKGRTFQAKRPISDYLGNKAPIKSYKLKKRLIREKIVESKCSGCKLEKWLDYPIPLELHHIDGDHANNKLSNLCLLCPNCHALTPTYRGKNIGKSNL